MFLYFEKKIPQIRGMDRFQKDKSESKKTSNT